jgi:hypothetical protein
MSGHGDPHDEAGAGEHDEHDEHEHDAHHAPPPLEEPVTPLWLTLLGVSLFLVAGILFVATRSDGKTTAELTAVPSADAPPSAVAAAPAAPNPVAPNPALRLKAPTAAPNPAARPQPAARP